jgi:ribosomal protein L24
MPILMVLPDDGTAMRGDIVIVQKVGDFYLKSGTVTVVDAALNKLTVLVSGTQDIYLTMPVPWTSVSPNPAALRFMLARGYNVAAGDVIKVVRGAAWNLSGIILNVNLTNKTLTFQGPYAKVL